MHGKWLRFPRRAREREKRPLLFFFLSPEKSPICAWKGGSVLFDLCGSFQRGGTAEQREEGTDAHLIKAVVSLPEGFSLVSVADKKAFRLHLQHGIRVIAKKTSDEAKQFYPRTVNRKQNG